MYVWTELRAIRKSCPKLKSWTTKQFRLSLLWLVHARSHLDFHLESMNFQSKIVMHKPLNSSNFRTLLRFSCPFRQVFYHPALKLSKNDRLRGVVDLCDPKWRCMLLSFLICFSAGQRHYVSQIFKQKVKYKWVVIWIRKCEIKERGSKKTGFGKRIGLKQIISCSKAEIRKWNILVEK